MDLPSLHIAMYPWFALGHLTPYLHLSNKLAQRGHRISFFVPRKTQPKIQHFNGFPHLITFVPITVPHVDGLPSGAETTSDVPSPLFPLITIAMDRTQDDIELLLRHLKPHLVFFDFSYWIPKMARRLGIKTVYYSILSPVTTGYSFGREVPADDDDLIQTWLRPPPGFPDDSSTMNLHLHETRFFVQKSKPNPFGGNNSLSLHNRVSLSFKECDVLGFKSCRETEGPYIDYLERKFGKPLLLAGPVIPESPVNTTLEEKWVNFLDRFEGGSVVFCVFGSECGLKKDQFQELLLGFELSGLPFLAALKPPSGAESIEEALPEGFEERIGGRGVVHGGWIQQKLILEHPSVGCFVTHCGSGSINEALVSKCRLVMIPYEGDQIFLARLIGNKLKAGIEVERREEDGFFTRESMCKALKTVMELENGEVGREVRANHAKLRELFLGKDFESSYIDNFSHKLQALLA